MLNEYVYVLKGIKFVRKEASELLQVLERQGYEAYFVGGCVRDFLLKRPIHDIDICTSALPEQVMNCFEQTHTTGIRHGTITVIWKEAAYEVTTFRSEGDYEDFRRPKQVSFVPSLRVDLSRRDLTMNALAMDNKGILYDYFQGEMHIHDRILETVGSAHERFAEDALRMLRVIRFAAQLDFEATNQVKDAIVDYAYLLEHISLERQTAELEKIIAGPYIVKGLCLLLETKMMENHALLAHIKRGLKRSSECSLNELDIVERWIFVLSFDHPSHVNQFLQKVTLPKVILKPLRKGLHMIREFDGIVGADQILPIVWVKLGMNNLKSLLKINQLICNGHIDQKRLNETEQQFHMLPIKSIQDLDITGKDLIEIAKVPPGPWIEECLWTLLESVLMGTVPNQKQSLIQEIEK